MALSIGQVADAADVNIQTIRYYERRGLFATPKRTPAGYRQYADDAVARLRFIKHAQVCRGVDANPSRYDGHLHFRRLRARPQDG